MAFVVIAVLLCTPQPSFADPDPSGPASGSTTDNSLLVEVTKSAQVESRGTGEVQDSSSGPEGPVFTAGSQVCFAADQVVVVETGAPLQVGFCGGDQDEAAAQPVLTVGLIRRAFAELELPAGQLVVQPPDGLTLVNFDTNFYTTSTEPIARTVTLLGQRVTLEATPATYHWDFGDGRTLSTPEPGAPYPRLDVTHNYLRTGTYRPSLSTTYTGRYRVGGGAWQEIPGTVTIDGAGQALRAIEAQPKLVGY